jgi:hypothetical protein
MPKYSNFLLKEFAEFLQTKFDYVLTKDFFPWK